MLAVPLFLEIPFQNKSGSSKVSRFFFCIFNIYTYIFFFEREREKNLPLDYFVGHTHGRMLSCLYNFVLYCIVYLDILVRAEFDIYYSPLMC